MKLIRNLFLHATEHYYIDRGNNLWYDTPVLVVEITGAEGGVWGQGEGGRGD